MNSQQRPGPVRFNIYQSYLEHILIENTLLFAFQVEKILRHMRRRDVLGAKM